MSWIRRAYGCDCGCDDCETCHPELQEFVECECCGAQVHRYEYCEQTRRCPDCEAASMIQCEVCGKWFADNTGEDWAEENIVFCSDECKAKCHHTPTTPSPGGNPGNFSTSEVMA